jgi:ketosteroid isomerase-like protein
MIRISLCITALALCASKLLAAPVSADSDKLWALEKAYWHYVQTDDLNSYRSLWHANFLGWPYISPEPLGKEHITDWIAAFKKNGDAVNSYDLEQLSVQVTDGNLATTTYRIHVKWLNKSGAERTVVSRIIHTWLRTPAGSWQIISGMSALANSEEH